VYDNKNLTKMGREIIGTIEKSPEGLTVAQKAEWLRDNAGQVGRVVPPGGKDERDTLGAFETWRLIAHVIRGEGKGLSNFSRDIIEAEYRRNQAMPEDERARLREIYVDPELFRKTFEIEP